MSRPRHPALPLLAVAGLATAGFVILARRVAEHETAHTDGRARKKVPKRVGPRRKSAIKAVGLLGEPWIHGPLAAGLAAYARPRTRSGAAMIALSSAGAAGLSKILDRVVAKRAPPPGRRSPTTQSFPSGHSLETAAVALTSAYVLAREGRANPWLAIPAAIGIPAISGAGRIALDRHWLTDVLAGWLAGLGVAALCAAAYESLPD